MGKARLWFVASLLSANACIVGGQDATGKRCLAPTDCPTGFVCTAVDQEEQVCLPEGLASLIREGEGDGGTGGGEQPSGDGGANTRPDAGENTAPDGGGNTAPDGGVAAGPTYCTEVKPVLAAYCTACHASPPSNGAPSYFRLDQYANSGLVQGAGAQASRIDARVSAGSMPPAGWPQPTQEERDLIAEWAAAGAPECGTTANPVDGGTEPTDAGQSTPDAGNGGTIPTVVSFSQHVQPIFDAYCVSCHNDGNDDNAGDLKLEDDESYEELLDESECNNNYWLVEPGDPQSSMLWLVLSAHSSACAPPMPLNTPGLKTIAPTEFAIIEKWIQQGAPNN